MEIGKFDWIPDKPYPESENVPIRQPLCMVCSHLRGDEMKCDAFPDGIPRMFWDNSGVDHLTPVEGDRGITFDLAED